MKLPLHRIRDEWNHRREVQPILNRHNISVSRWYEFRFAVLGKIISASCHLIGWFMPSFFGGKPEAMFVYFRMKRYFTPAGIYDWDHLLYHEHEGKRTRSICLKKVKHSRVLPYFERLLTGA